MPAVDDAVVVPSGWSGLIPSLLATADAVAIQDQPLGQTMREEMDAHLSAVLEEASCDG